MVFLASSQRLPAAEEVSDVPEGSSENTRTTVLTNPIRGISGPKRRIAVGTFDAVGALTAYYGNRNIGGGRGAMPGWVPHWRIEERLERSVCAFPGAGQPRKIS